MNSATLALAFVALVSCVLTIGAQRTFGEVRACIKQAQEDCYTPCIEFVSTHRYLNMDCHRELERNRQLRIFNCSKKTGIEYNADSKPCFKVIAGQPREPREANPSTPVPTQTPAPTSDGKSPWNAYNYDTRYPELKDQFDCYRKCIKGKTEACYVGCPTVQHFRTSKKGTNTLMRCYHEAPTPSDTFDACMKTAGYTPHGWGR